MESVLVTGGAGFVGAALAIAAKRAYPRARIIAMDNLKRRGSELKLPILRERGVEFIHGDIRNPEDFDPIDGVDVVLECSAEPSILAGYGPSPGYVINTNLNGTVNCLDFARRCGAATIFLSTSRIYPIEAQNGLPYTEEDTRFALAAEQSLPGVSERGISEDFPLPGARSMYGATKLSSELILHEYRETFGLKALVNRCGIIAGPWQMGKVDQGVVTLWAARHVLGGSLDYIGYGGLGKQVRDMLHLDDLVELILYQMERLDELDGETFNVGGGLENSVSLCELTKICEELTGNSIEIGSVSEDRQGDVRIYYTDYARVSERCGWRPERDIKTIVGDIVTWLEAHKEELGPILA